MKRPEIRFRISAVALLWLALLLLVLPLKWVTAAIAAAAFHEICHMLAFQICSVRVNQMQIGGYGTVLEAAALTPGQELLCALAGPAGSLLLAALSRWFPRIAVCALVHAVYNLLPVYPLDGGRALRCAVMLMRPEKADQVCLWSARFVCLTLLLAAAYGAFVLDLGVFPLLLAGFLVRKAFPGKISCKAGPSAVQ